MGDISPQDAGQVLRDLHETLDLHFRALGDTRRQLDPASPVFALEHELTDAQAELLALSVRSVVADGFPSAAKTSWLPFVVYAAESGYTYAGSEYWSTFEAATPGWRGDHRSWLKQQFLQFADQYSGAVPSGAFAQTFRIIAWPITHAVLPTYLQRQLAQLLYDFRTGLSSALLDDPDELGLRLAARSRNYTERFRVFCQNSALLGQVAAALLSGDEGESPYLVKSTLDRIVVGLSHERQSRIWLSTAQQSASRVRLSGFSKSSERRTTTSSAQRLPRATDPKLFLRYVEGAWRAYAELPDLTPLTHRLPQVYDDARRSRARVVGVQQPTPTGALCYAGQEVQFDSWPNPTTPFLRLERADESVNALLADQCVLTQGPWWLFRLHGRGLAIEVKSKALRPGRSYVLIGDQGLVGPGVSWCAKVPMECLGAVAYRLDLPDRLTESELALLTSFGIAALSNIAIRPVATVPSAWDGEGAAEWLAGDTAIVGIRSEVAPSRVIGTVDQVAFDLRWPDEQADMLLALEDLEVGGHVLALSLYGPDESELAQGTLGITVRDPQVRGENASAGEGLRLLSAPARPTMAELWDGRADLSVVGPVGAGADLTVVFRGSDMGELATIKRKVTLPFDSSGWTAQTRSIRSEHIFKEHYDDADSCVISFSRAGIGMASLTCERGFQPLRWRLARRHDGSVSARLRDLTDGGHTRLSFYDVEAPSTARALEPEAAFALPPRGGLLSAVSDEITATVVAPTNPNAMISLGVPRPVVRCANRSPAALLKLAQCHRLWADADLPGDPFAARQQDIALEAIARAINESIGGSHWARLEHLISSSRDHADLLDQMQAAVGESKAHQALAATIGASLYKWLTPEALLPGFADVIGPALVEAAIKDQPSAPRFLLTLAGRPGQISEWTAETQSYLLDHVLTSPVLLRAARFAVLGTRAINELEMASGGF